jgi:hypothetical protein
MNGGGDGGGANSALDIQKLPETKTGIKLKQKLEQDPNLKAIIEGKKKLSEMDLAERSVVLSTLELYKAIDSSSGVEQTMFLYTIFNILDNILNYPYSDDQRILYLGRYKMKVFKLEVT